MRCISSAETVMFRDCNLWIACAENLRGAPCATPVCVRTSRKDGPVVGGICTGTPCGRTGAVLGGMILTESGILGSMTLLNDPGDLRHLERQRVATRVRDDFSAAVHERKLRRPVHDGDAGNFAADRRAVTARICGVDAHRVPDQRRGVRQRDALLETLERVCQLNLRVER